MISIQKIQNAARPATLSAQLERALRPRSPRSPTGATTIDAPPPRAGWRRRTWAGQRWLPLPFKFPAPALDYPADSYASLTFFLLFPAMPFTKVFNHV